MAPPNSASLAGPETPSPHTAPSSSLSTPPQHNRTHHRRTSSGWSESAADRDADIPLLAFAVDPTDETRDALTAAGKSSWVLTECVDAVNHFSEAPCFKALLRELLDRCTAALSVRLAGASSASLTADYLHATITNKLQLNITAEPCLRKEHIMETVPATGEIRIDAELLEHMRSIPQPTPGAAAADSTTAVIKALVMVKLLHEVAHQHTRGLMHHIRTNCNRRDIRILDDTPPRLCTYVAGRAKKTKFGSRGKPVKRGEMGTAMEEALLDGRSLQLPRHTTYADLTALVAHRDDSNDYLLTAAGIDRLQPGRFTAECRDGTAFYVEHFLEELHTQKKRRVSET